MRFYGAKTFFGILRSISAVSPKYLVWFGYDMTVLLYNFYTFITKWGIVNSIDSVAVAFFGLKAFGAENAETWDERHFGWW